MYLRTEMTTTAILIVVVLLLTGTNVSSNPQCSFVSCARRNLEFNVTDSPIILPCDNLTSVNTNNTIGGNYSYCHNEELLVSQSTNYYTLELDISFNGATVCCYNHDIEACGICYNLIIYYAPTDQGAINGPLPHFGQPYTANCESEGNPPPVCRWFRESNTPVDSNYTYEFIDDGSGADLVLDNIVPITNDVTFTNNGCTIHIPRLERIHSGQYVCIATNSLGRGVAALPTISFNLCLLPLTTSIVSAGSTTIKALLNETVRLTCSVSPAVSDFTTIQFTFSNTNYTDFIGPPYPDGITANSVYHNENCSLESMLIIEHFSQQFVGQYSCSASIFGTGGATGNNVTFNVSIEEKTTTASSDSGENRGLIIGIPLAILVVLIVMIVIFIFVRISTKRRSALNILKYPPPPHSTEQFEYDAFVSHATDAEEFAELVIRKGLKERGYKVQMPGDFMAGNSTDENIIDAYTASRYIVILFSEKYSHNCSELIYAYNKLEMTRTNCVIPVMCGAMVPETLKHVTYADSEVDDVVDRVAITIGTPLCKA